MNRVQHYFMRGISAVFIAGAMNTPVAGAAPEEAASPGAKTCVSIHEVKAGQREEAAYIARLFNTAGIPIDQPKIGAKNFFICLEPLLFYREMIDGAYDYDADVMRIDMSDNSNDTNRVLILKHELRHRAQRVMGVDFTRAINVPEAERITAGLLSEADAMLDEVLLADAARRRGDPGFVTSLRKELMGARLLHVYDEKLRRAPDDRKAAMQAVIYEFLSNRRKVGFYTDYYISSMNGPQYERFAFKPEQPRGAMLDNAALKKFGERAGVGNYMDEPMMQRVRQLYTQAQYESAVAEFKKDGFALKAGPR